MTTPSAETQWFIAREGKQYGPLSELEMRKLIELGHLKPNDLIWRPGFSDWRPASTLAPAAPVAPQPAAPVAQAQARPQPQAPQAQPAQAQPSQPRTQPLAAEIHRNDGGTSGRQVGGPSVTGGNPNPMGSMGQTSPRADAPAPSSQPLTDLRRAMHQASQPSPSPAPGLSTLQPPGAGMTQRPGMALPAAQPNLPAGQRPATGTAVVPATRRPQAVEPVEARIPRIEDDVDPPRRGRTMTYVAAGLVLLVAAGAGLILAQKRGGGDKVAATVSPGTVSANVAPLGSLSDNTDTLDAQFQRTPMWSVVKREFPEWYGERLKEAAKLTADKKTEDSVAKHLTEALVALRRQHADKALAASTPKLKEVANAFLGNLKSLAAKSTTACYNFISQGETSPTVIEMMRSPDQNAAVQAQVASIFEAIAEGRKSPTTHPAPVKADYDALADQLTKLGWTQADLQLFADSKALARATPDKVCKMVQDWFIAHISIQDGAVQERLLVETLRPVVAG